MRQRQPVTTEYVGPGFKWRVVRRVRHIERVNDVLAWPGYSKYIPRKVKLNRARLRLRVKSLKQFRYDVREVYHELTADDELAILNFPGVLAFKSLEQAIEAGHLLTRSTDIDAARSKVEAMRQKREVA